MKLALEKLDYKVYDGFLPPDGTPYPFIYLGDFRQLDIANKTAVHGDVYATIHVWSNKPGNRGTVSKIMLDIKTVCRQIEHTDSFAWAVRGMEQSIKPDNTTKSPLLHGVVEPHFYFS